MSNSLWPYELWLAGLLFLCDSPGKNTGVGCHSLVQGIFWTQGLNACCMIPALVGGFFTSSTTWEALLTGQGTVKPNVAFIIGFGIRQTWIIIPASLFISCESFCRVTCLHLGLLICESGQKKTCILGSVERIKWIKKAHPYSFLGYSKHSEHDHISSTLSYSFSRFKSSESRACFQSLTSWNCNWWYFVLFLRGNNLETRLGSNGILESIKYGGSWSSSFK